MSVYDLHYNKDSSVIRTIIIGLLSTLQNHVGWKNQIGPNVEDHIDISVPFYFSITGTERYLQDNFLNNIDFDPASINAEAMYSQIPRGVIDLTGINIESQSIVNKYVRINHQVQEDDGSLNTYNTEAFWVPIILDFSCEIAVDSILDQLKCAESLIKSFYKSKTYQVDSISTRIPCVIVFPEDITTERTVEFTYDDKKEFKVSVSLQVKTYLPIFNENTTMFAGNTMESFGNSTVNLPPFTNATGLTNNNGTTNKTLYDPVVNVRDVNLDTNWPNKTGGNFPPV